MDVEYESDEKMPKGLAIFFMILAVIWGISVIAAFITSLVCFGKSGTTVDKVIGFLLAFFFGPFYFIYLIVNKKYCRA